eukprot:2632759-Rhodomonas_salina.1
MAVVAAYFLIPPSEQPPSQVSCQNKTRCGMPGEWENRQFGFHVTSKHNLSTAKKSRKRRRENNPAGAMSLDLAS